MFFAKAGEVEPCGIFTLGHLILVIIFLVIIAIAVKFTNIKNNETIKKLIQKLTIIMWLFEIVKIIYNSMYAGGLVINKVIPLYYCSLLLYAGILSSIGKNKVKRIGDVFLASGSIVAGIVFYIFPTTSLPEYPIIHFISIYSFLFHGIMIYLGIIINKYKYIILEKKDIKYYSVLILCICILAYIVNYFCDSNLMFISKDFPTTPITYIYKFTGKLFPIVMSIVQMTLPFYIVYGIIKIKRKINMKKILVLNGGENK